MPNPPSQSRVVVLGASNSPDRFSHKAVLSLVQSGFETVPVNPNASEVAGIPCISALSEVESPIDTVTVYLSAARSMPLGEDLISLEPRRVIFNPGAENQDLKQSLQSNGIECVDACTLVMLDSGTF